MRTTSAGPRETRRTSQSILGSFPFGSLNKTPTTMQKKTQNGTNKKPKLSQKQRKDRPRTTSTNKSKTMTILSTFVDVGALDWRRGGGRGGLFLTKTDTSNSEHAWHPCKQGAADSRGLRHSADPNGSRLESLKSKESKESKGY